MKKCVECGCKYKITKKMKKENIKIMCPNCGRVNTSKKTFKEILKFLWNS